jgi:hypothetical protein
MLYALSFGVLILYLLLLFCIIISIPNARTLWADKQWAEDRIGRAQTLEEMRQVARSAASSISVAENYWSSRLNILTGASAATACFLVWSVITLRDMKREVGDFA